METEQSINTLKYPDPEKPLQDNQETEELTIDPEDVNLKPVKSNDEEANAGKPQKANRLVDAFNLSISQRNFRSQDDPHPTEAHKKRRFLIDEATTGIKKIKKQKPKKEEPNRSIPLPKMMMKGMEQEEIEEVEEDIEKGEGYNLYCKNPETPAFFSSLLAKQIKKKYEFFVTVNLVDSKFGVKILDCEVKRGDRECKTRPNSRIIALYNTKMAEKRIEIEKGQDYRILSSKKPQSLSFKMPFSDVCGQVVVIDAVFPCN